jgi:hypothetical protein
MLQCFNASMLQSKLLSTSGENNLAALLWRGDFMKEKAMPVQVQKESKDSAEITIGKTVFYVKVHFGKIPLEDILRQRIVSERLKRTQ